MRGRKLLGALVQLSRFGLAALFVFAAGAKLFTLGDFRVNLSNLVAQQWVWPVAAAVIVSELTTGVLLVIPRAVRAGATLAALMLSGFAAYALYYVYAVGGEPLECGCFGGIIASQLGVSTALRNLALIVPVALVLFAWPRVAKSKGEPERIERGTAEAV